MSIRNSLYESTMTTPTKINLKLFSWSNCGFWSLRQKIKANIHSFSNQNVPGKAIWEKNLIKKSGEFYLNEVTSLLEKYEIKQLFVIEKCEEVKAEISSVLQQIGAIELKQESLTWEKVQEKVQSEQSNFFTITNDLLKQENDLLAALSQKLSSLKKLSKELKEQLHQLEESSQMGLLDDKCEKIKNWEKLFQKRFELVNDLHTGWKFSEFIVNHKRNFDNLKLDEITKQLDELSKSLQDLVDTVIKLLKTHKVYESDTYEEIRTDIIRKTLFQKTSEESEKSRENEKLDEETTAEEKNNFDNFLKSFYKLTQPEPEFLQLAIKDLAQKEGYDISLGNFENEKIVMRKEGEDIILQFQQKNLPIHLREKIESSKEPKFRNSLIAHIDLTYSVIINSKNDNVIIDENTVEIKINYESNTTRDKFEEALGSNWLKGLICAIIEYLQSMFNSHKSAQLNVVPA